MAGLMWTTFTVLLTISYYCILKMIMTHIQISWKQTRGTLGSWDAAIIDHNIPSGIGAHLSEGCNPSLGVQCDFVIANKDRGFLNHHSADFSFIGPHREIVGIENI